MKKIYEFEQTAGMEQLNSIVPRLLECLEELLLQGPGSCGVYDLQSGVNDGVVLIALRKTSEHSGIDYLTGDWLKHLREVVSGFDT